MRRILIDGEELAPKDPLRKLIEIELEIRLKRQYVTLEVLHEAGDPVHVRKIENFKLTEKRG